MTGLAYEEACTASTPHMPLDAPRQRPARPTAERAANDNIWNVEDGPAWLKVLLRLVRPIGVGSLIAVPTVGAAVCGLVALFSVATAVGMARASTLFLQGIPGELYMLVGFFGGGYTLAKTVERVRGVKR